MKHENPTVNHVLHDPLWEIFMPSANASAFHIIAPPPNVFTSQHPANASVLHIITPQFIVHTRSAAINASALHLVTPPFL